MLGLGAREGAAGAGPDYLQEESFGFGSPLLGPIQLTLPLPAAEKRQRLKRNPSRAPLRAALPSSPVSQRGAPAEPWPRRPASFRNSLLLEGCNEPRVQDVLLGLPSAVPGESHMHKIEPERQRHMRGRKRAHPSRKKKAQCPLPPLPPRPWTPRHSLNGPPLPFHQVLDTSLKNRKKKGGDVGVGRM